jgi:DNA processing protein
MLTEIEALVILTSIPYLGSVRIRALIQRFGTAQAVLEADPAVLAEFPDIGAKIVQGWRNWKSDASWKQNLELVERYNATIIPYTSQLYPKRLLEIPDYPVLLYVKGSLVGADQRGIAVVGTRFASIYGREMAEAISSELARAGFPVVSGLARGIDTAAHAGALRSGRTLAVIGSGLANIYPHENLRLSEAIAEKGALISEFPMMTPPDRQNFPQRNRIVAGMTMGTLLIEAPVRSGAMITMDRAATYKRPLFALPGRIDSEDFRGNHLLIKKGQAKLVENAGDVIENFESLFNLADYQVAPKMHTPLLQQEEYDFLKQLPNHELSIDEMMQITKLPVMKINVLLMGLVLKKAMKEFAGKIYRKV